MFYKSPGTAAYIPCTVKLLLGLQLGPWKGLHRVENALLQFKVKLNPLHSFDAVIVALAAEGDVL